MRKSGWKSSGILNEVAGMDLEETREQEAGGVGEVRTGAGLDL